jgi:putative ATPase
MIRVLAAVERNTRNVMASKSETLEQPLAVQIRPDSLDTFIGQTHLVGDQKPLRIAIEQKRLFSMIFWGTPGVGKTTLARILANAVDAEFVELSAVSAKKDDVKQVVEAAKSHPDKKTVLFLDEIHRFNKAQQDFLLPSVEAGIITLIGATTENPSFEVIAPLLSRCRVFVLNPLTAEEMQLVIDRATKKLKAKMNPEARDWLIAMANGDARQAITMIDNAYNLYHKLDIGALKNTLQNKHLRYDKLGEEHYNTISAYIKSMRASDVNAALYYLARMVDSGEDPKFIARRMVIFASEDIGLAQPTALVVANAVFEAVTKIGYPEAQINLAHGTAYLALAKKDRSAYDAYFHALDDVKKFGNLSIPMNVRNAPTKLMKELGYGKEYEAYTDKSLLPDELQNKKYLK